MSVMDCMRCSFVTDKDQLIHSSGSLINGQDENFYFVNFEVIKIIYSPDLKARFK
jgi:hypothetical protein